MRKLVIAAIAVLFFWSCGSNSENVPSNSEEVASEQSISEDNVSETDGETSTLKGDYIGASSKYDYADKQSYSGTTGTMVDILGLDEDFTACTEKESVRGDVALEMPCYVASYNQWDEALNQYFKSVLTYEDEDDPSRSYVDKDALIKAQQSWDKFRNAEKNLFKCSLPKFR